MRVSTRLIYANVAALSINGIIVWMTITKTFPVVVGVLLVAAFLAGAVWFSCLVNGVLPRQRKITFYLAKTQKVEGW